jgi:hypothetical protein
LYAFAVGYGLGFLVHFPTHSRQVKDRRRAPAKVRKNILKKMKKMAGAVPARAGTIFDSRVILP